MDATFFDDCCCGDHNNCADANCSDAMTSKDSVCCQVSTELNYNNEANEDLPVITSVEIRSNVDPPPAITSPIKQLVEPVRFTETSYRYTNPPDKLGSNTYLITQRLRI
jgi:hypothetical protein